MLRAKRLVAPLMLIAGIALAFAGVSASLGFTPLAMLASGGLIAALVYAGSVWFGGTAPPRPAGKAVLVYDTDLSLPSGAPLADGFPEPLRDDVRRHCLGALQGHRTTFVAGGRTFEVAPIVFADSAVHYGALIERAAVAPHDVRPHAADVTIPR